MSPTLTRHVQLEIMRLNVRLLDELFASYALEAVQIVSARFPIPTRIYKYIYICIYHAGENGFRSLLANSFRAHKIDEQIACSHCTYIHTLYMYIYIRVLIAEEYIGMRGRRWRWRQKQTFIIGSSLILFCRQRGDRKSVSPCKRLRN